MVQTVLIADPDSQVCEDNTVPYMIKRREKECMLKVQTCLSSFLCFYNIISQYNLHYSYLTTITCVAKLFLSAKQPSKPFNFEKLKADKMFPGLRCSHATKSSSEYAAFSESVGGVLERAPPKDSTDLLGDANA